jgi:hypothetical protein
VSANHSADRIRLWRASDIKQDGGFVPGEEGSACKEANGSVFDRHGFFPVKAFSCEDSRFGHRCVRSMSFSCQIRNFVACALRQR